MRAITAVVALVAVVALPSPAAAATSDVTCHYTVNSYPYGFVASIDIVNGGPRVDGWALRWTVPEGTELGNVWSARMTQPTPLEMTATNLVWNGSIASGTRVSFGWTARATTATVPTDITLNGTPC
ncbi:cellulose binding domain-containing protein [Catellatospora tritici]|uniref:cellulose binding domain-containing protein n=1 Tax=Catellatospora tritici TaxID=2851566 RepID=UPI001C2DC3FD|nr:cellulose binding domain-containing protein [Catellatospora tritici]MBV1854778.1 cellulose-binding domain-containing protein [Catellatospora tritici]